VRRTGIDSASPPCIHHSAFSILHSPSSLRFQTDTHGLRILICCKVQQCNISFQPSAAQAFGWLHPALPRMQRSVLRGVSPGCHPSHSLAGAFQPTEADVTFCSYSGIRGRIPCSGVTRFFQISGCNREVQHRNISTETSQNQAVPLLHSGYGFPIKCSKNR
jgi:hypothetical protein